jgi:hypothetical protein
MPSTSIIFGIILIFIAIVGAAFGFFSDHFSPTALIPAVFGLVLIVLGRLAQSKENLRKHLMHAAVIVGLAGFVFPAIRLLSKLSELTLGAPVIAQIAMSAVCLIFVILCVKSFVIARRS